MKYILLPFLFLYSINSHAQTCKETRLSIQTNFVYGIPTGDYSYKNSNSLYVGQTNNNLGGGIVLRKPVYKNFGLGFNIKTVTVKLNKENINNNLKREYNNDNKYFMTTSFKTNYVLFDLGIEFFKNFIYKSITVRPFVRLNLAGSSDIGTINVNLKQRNHNYFETYKIVHTKNENDITLFFLPSIGTEFNVAINNHWGINTGAIYSLGKKKFNPTISKNNLFNQKTELQETSEQLFSSVQTFLGLQYYFGR